MNTPTMPEPQKRRLQAHFSFTKVPFRKNMLAQDMFDSRSQRELLHGLILWLEINGFALVTGLSGIGKSITVRRFVSSLDQARFAVTSIHSAPSTRVGFLRTLNRALGLPMRAHAADLFDQARKHLAASQDDKGLHQLLVIDDAEGMSVENLDLLRRLTAWGLDAEDHFSVLVTGTPDLLRTLRAPELEPLRTRISYAWALKPFSLEDTRNYVAFHLKRAGGDPGIFSDDAVRRAFQYSQGRPRLVNQLAIGALIQAAVEGLDTVSNDVMAACIAANPLYGNNPGANP